MSSSPGVSCWTPVPGEVQGNDHTQSRQEQDGSWSLTWALANRGTASYRLTWGP